MEVNEFLKNVRIIFGKYRIIKKTRSDSFNEIYLGKQILDNKPVTIKVEKINTEHQILKQEAYTLYLLKGIGIPKVLSYGISKKYKILILPLLGESLEDIYIKNGKQFSLPESCMIAIQVLDRIEFIHSKYYIHRDIKPDNFLIGKEDPNIIYLVNFGLSKKYRSTKTKNHVRFSNTGRLTGTLRYASSNALKGSEQSRRDDLISIGYMLIYFMKRELPWQRIRDKNETERYIKIYKMKKEIKPEILCQGLPNEMVEYMKYVQHLGFEQDPDYKYLRNLFKSILRQLNPNIERYLFIWIKANNILNFNDPIKRQKRRRRIHMNSKIYNNIMNNLNLNENERNSSFNSSVNYSLGPAPPALPNLAISRNNSEGLFSLNSNI